MGSLILLIVAAIWIAVLVPPLLRSRLENRPNSSVSDFRNQLSSLQKAVPSTRAGTMSMRGMARPLAPSALARPAAPGRPLRSGVTLASGGSTRSPRQQAALSPAADTFRTTDPTRRGRGEAPMRSHGTVAAMSEREARKRRQANVLFVLGVVAACSVFLAVSTKTAGVAWVAGIACVSLVGYMFMLAQQANLNRGGGAASARTRRVAGDVRSHDRSAGPRQHRSQAAPRRRIERDERDQWDDASAWAERDRSERGERQYRGARGQSPAPATARRRRPVEAERWDEELWGEPRRADRPRRQAPRPQAARDDAPRRQAPRPRAWSEDPRPSGVVYGDPLFMSREQPIVRRERPTARRRQHEWSSVG